MGELFIGTSGYNYKDWRERFYPPHLAQKHWLPFYASQFNTLEVNATFYRHFARSVYEKWYQQTPDAFRFTIKGPRLITHVKRLHDCKDALHMFLESASGLAKKLSVILWQFPASFHATGENKSRVTAFFTSLPQHIHQVFEFRHTSWFQQDVYDVLDQANAGFVINDTTAFPKAEAITGDIVYIRFHGPEALYASSYSNDQLQVWAIKIRQYLHTCNVYCYFNNDSSAYAVHNAIALRNLLK